MDAEQVDSSSQPGKTVLLASGDALLQYCTLGYTGPGINAQ